MSRARSSALVALLLALSSTGCSMDLASGGGASTPDGNGLVTGHLAVSTKLPAPINSDGFLAGVELASRSEIGYGTRWTTGIRLGYGKSPGLHPGSIGWELYGDIGARIGKGGLLPNHDFYYGGSFALPISLSEQHEDSDLNGPSWILIRTIELAPLARIRANLDHPDGLPNTHRIDFQGGLVVRLRFVSDYF